MQRFQSAIAFACTIGAVAVACGGSSSGGGSSGTAASSTGTTVGGNPDSSSETTTDASTGIGASSGATASSGTTASSGVATASSGTTSVGGSCSLGAGTYTIHYVATSGGVLCQTLPDGMMTLAQNETPADVMNLGMDAGTCTTTESGCTVMVHCNEGETGFNIQFTFNVTVGNNSAAGTLTEAVSEDGSVLANCAYNVTYTKN